MQSFRTTLNVEESVAKIELNQRVTSLGSCFADNIGDKLLDYKFNVLKNPFGTLFNPLAIFEVMELALGTKTLADDLFLSIDDLYMHYHFHSDISSVNLQKLQAIISHGLATAKDWLSTSSFLLLTFGSAFVYQLRQSGAIVANCHRQPSALFAKKLLSVDEIIQAFAQVYPNLPSDMKIIITVSPVRHMRDQLTLNTLSKSTLILAAHEMVAQYANVVYFPGYELLVDDLRDYRFYQTDLVHPDQLAIDYIWEAFSKGFISSGAQSFITRWDSLRRSIFHRPRNPGSLSHRKFLTCLLAELQEVSEVDTTSEQEEIKAKLAAFP